MTAPYTVAQSWLRKAESQRDDIDRFVACWFAFNALYNGFLANGERAAIGDFVFAGENRLDNRSLQSVLDSPDARFFRRRIIRDVRGGGDTAEQAQVLSSGHHSANRRLKALALILYQVRCNLFHGNKLYDRDSDHEVIGHAAAVLMLLLKSYLRKPVLA